MISLIQNSSFTKILSGLIALYLLNISVDIADPNPDYIPEDLSFNDQESLFEIFVEQILGYENAIREFDDPDTGDHNKKKTVKVDLTVHQIKKADPHHPLKFKKIRCHHYEARIRSGFVETDSPPPEV